MAESIKNSSIEKLGLSNYSSWKFEMKMVLIQQDLWKYVNSNKPEAPDDAWDRGNMKALATIALGCERSQQSLIRECLDAKSAWGELNKHNIKRTVVSKVSLIKKVCRKQFIDGEDIEQHIREFDDLFETCDSSDMNFAETFKVVLLLASLSESYETLVISLEARNEPELTLPLVKQKILDEYQRMQDKQCNENNQAMLARAKKPIDKKPVDRKPGCWHCGDLNHIRRNCPKYAPPVLPSNQQLHLVRDDDTFDELITFMVAPVLSNKMEESSCWYLDSGATKHISKDKALFKNLSMRKGGHVQVANGMKVAEEGQGEVHLMCQDDKGNVREIKIDQVIYLPDIQANLISIGKLVEKGFIVKFEERSCKIIKNGIVIAMADYVNGLFRLKEADFSLLTQHGGHKENCRHQWHRRLGHRDYKAIRSMENSDVVTGFNVNECGIEEKCECCLEAKLTRYPFPTAEKITTGILQIIHTDLCGPIEPVSLGGSRYVMTLIDDYSNYSRVYFLKAKSETAGKIIEFVAEMKTKLGKVPEVMRSDRGGEYTSKRLLEFYRREGITPQFSVPYSPQQNGKAERKNRYLIEMTRCLLTDSKLDKNLWCEAMMTANYLQNRLPTSAADRTPYEMWHGRRPDYSSIKVFGSQAWVQIPRVKRKKLDASAICMQFVGYASQQKGYRFWNENKKEIVISRDARFVELGNGSYGKCAVENNVVSSENRFYSNNDDVTAVEVIQNEANEPVSPVVEQVQPPPSQVVVEEEEVQTTPDLNENQLRRSTRTTRGMIDPFIRENYILYYAQSLVDEPRTFEEAMASEEQSEWAQAMNDEIEALKVTNTWVLVDRPAQTNVVGSKWVFKRKHDEDGNPTKFRARLVAQGFSQKYGVDYDEVFAPVIKPTTIRLLLTIAGKNNYFVRHVDIKTAFLNGEVDTVIYMKQPPGFIDPVNSDKVCLLKRSLYGLKQSARQWNKMLCDVLEKLKFNRSEEDDCLFLKSSSGGTIFILVYVDDLMLIGPDNVELIQIEEELAKRFKLIIMGPVRHFLGMKLQRDDSGIFSIDQTAYIEKVLSRFNLKDAKPSKIPLDPAYVNTVDDSEPFSQQHLYRGIIGALLYLSGTSRPDIAAATSILSRKNSSPSLRDWNEAKRVLRYINGSKHLVLKLGNDNHHSDNKLIGYADADHAGDLLERKSNSGYVFLYSGALISWACRKQTSVAISSTEAEYIALCEAVQEAVVLRRLLQSIGYSQLVPTTIYEDNQSCMKLVTCERIGRRSKHIETQYHYSREQKEKGTIELKYCPTEDMAADLFTKPLNSIKIKKFREIIGLQPSSMVNHIEEEC